MRCRAALPITLVVAIAVALGCRGADGPERTAASDAGAPRSTFVDAGGVRLHALDWGGAGPPLVMIHGIGDNPYVFSDLAPHLRASFRPIAYARRGHGQSDAPAGPYDLPTLVEDLRHVVDHFDLERPTLLGWSMGGNEITRFAGLHPDRVAALVYLESGYDWSDPAFLPSFGAMLGAMGPDAAALRSLDAYRSWFRSAWMGPIEWTPGLEAYLRDSLRIHPDGSVEPIPDARVFEALFASLSAPPRDYASVRAPAVALYSPAFFPPDPADPAHAPRVRDWERHVMDPFRVASVARLRRELPGVRVEQIPDTTHMSIGFHAPAALAATIRDAIGSEQTGD